MENFIWQFIILLNKAKTSETRIYAEGYQFLLPNIIDNAEGSSNQAKEQIESFYAFGFILAK